MKKLVIYLSILVFGINIYAQNNWNIYNNSNGIKSITLAKTLKTNSNGDINVYNYINGIRVESSSKTIRKNSNGDVDIYNNTQNCCVRTVIGHPNSVYWCDEW